MIVEIKVNYHELLGDGTMRIAVNVEDFKAMLDGINPRIYCDYLYETITKRKEGEVCRKER